MIKFLLLAYGICLGLPDVALEIFTTRLRLDDIVITAVMVYSLADRSWHPFDRHQKVPLGAMLLFGVYCLISSLIVYSSDLPFPLYPLSRCIGCMVILITIPQLIKSHKDYNLFAWGLLIGGCILLGQLAFRLNSVINAASYMSQSHELKTSLSFETWNPNTISNYAIMLAFILLLVGSENRGVQRLVFLTAAGVFSLIPLVTFCRGATAGIAAFWMIFIFLTNRLWAVKLMAVFLFGLVLLYLATYYEPLLRTAFDINLATGEGFAGRYECWVTSLGLIEQAPIIGHGFGQEVRLFVAAMGRGSSHNAFLSVLVECGFLALVLFVWPLMYIARHFWRRFRNNRNDTTAIICLASLTMLLVRNLSSSGLYWYKAEIIILALLIASLRSESIISRGNNSNKSRI